MEIYIEDVLFQNFIVTFIVIYCTFKLLKENIKKWRMTLACFVGSIGALLSPLVAFNTFLSFGFKICVSVLIVFCVCSPYKLKKFFLLYIVFIFMTALYGGMSIMLSFIVYGNLNGNVFLINFGIFFTFFLLCQINKYVQNRYELNNFIYDVTIINQQKSYKVKAFLDSGNTLCDEESGKPVMIINFKLFNKIFENMTLEKLISKKIEELKSAHYISIKTAISNGEMLVFSVDEVEIKVKNRLVKVQQACFGLSYSNLNTKLNCDILLNSKLLIN